MKIVIAGAGAVGFHLATLLSNEKRDITLIDSNKDVLDYASTHLDVMTIHGDACSVEILKKAESGKAKLFLAVTRSEKANLIAAILAKNEGAKKTIARVSSMEYLEEDKQSLFDSLGIDHLISPNSLAANEIKRLIEVGGVTDNYEFENGEISLFGVKMGDDSRCVNRSLEEISKEFSDDIFRIIAIHRGNGTLIPRGDTIIRRGDQLYFLSSTTNRDDILDFIGTKKRKAKKIMIIGGSELGLLTAKLLEEKYDIIIIENDGEKCDQLTMELNNSLVINGDASNFDLLKEEGLAEMDVILTLLPNSETNILISLMAEKLGAFRTIALVDNIEYIHISQNIGIDTLINKKLIAANNIFRFIRKGQIEAICTFYGVDAEIIEFAISHSGRITKHKLKDLHFPKNAMIGAIFRRGEVIIPTGEIILEVGDKVIVFTMPEALSKVEKFF